MSWFRPRREQSAGQRAVATAAWHAVSGVEPDPPGLYDFTHVPLSEDARRLIARMARAAAKDAVAELIEDLTAHPEKLITDPVMTHVETLVRRALLPIIDQELSE